MAGDLAGRLLGRDKSLWPEGNVAASRLGWLDSAGRYLDQVAELQEFADQVDAERVLLLGMGGSSLGPLVLSRWASTRPVEVLDTTAPEEVERATESLDDAFIVVSSKSGTTLEVETLLARCWERLPDPARYAVVTDPNSALLEGPLADSRQFVNDPNIGGRYSVLSYFGLVPAALGGVDLESVLTGAQEADFHEAVRLGEEIAEAAVAGRDKLTITGLHEFGLWVEQLIAESTGKQGVGVIPLPVGDESEGGPDRQHAEVEIGSVRDLGREFYRWMVATAVMGAVLEIDPFDEPDVAAAKQATNQALGELPLPRPEPLKARELASWLADQFTDGDYLSLQAYLPYGQQNQLEDLRRRARDLLRGGAVTAGFGPRFLHSTGQLHKGGPNSVVAVQILPASGRPEVPIPGKPYDFATLIEAQALGDLRTLTERGRRAVRIEVDDLAQVLPA